MSSSTSGPHAAAGSTPTPAPSDLLVELRRALAGRFDVERLLGVGGMGSVYVGRDVTLDRPVAIKVVNPDVALAPTVRARFLAEARTVARLRHPHVVAVHAAGEADGMLYFVMEYVPGESLRDRLARDGRFDDRAAIVVLRDLARALGYAHAQGIVHRDVKPENVLLDRESGRAMLTDFGVAQALAAQAEGDGRLTGLGIVLGSPRYMSPEQAAGERRLDGRSDVYALGLVAYEMFAGEPAVTATSAATILVKHLTEKPTPIATRSARVTPELADVIERALEKDPAHRWPTADAMADALEAALASWDGAPLPARPLGAGRATADAPPPAAAPAAPARHRRALLVGGALALAAAAALGWWALGARRGGVPGGVDPRRSYLVAPFEVQSGDPQLTWLREGSVSMLALNLSQWRDLQVVDYERALDLLRDLELDDERRLTREDALRLARRAGVWTAVTGVVTGTPDSLFVAATVWDVATGQSVDRAQRAAPRSADPRGLFDALARELLDLAGAPQTTVALAQSTTSSLEAYRAYLDGSRALNAWRLGRADSLFQRATALDSTFALAHYRRALTLGWGASGSGDQAQAVRAAQRHAARLPQRERALVDAYAEFADAMRAQQRGDTATEGAAFVAAQRQYAAIVARDSGDAEAWYGLGDALWHHRPGGWASEHAVDNWSGALRAFNRTLALDSSFHLAYSHKLDMYRAAADPGSPVVLVGDALRHVGGDAAARAADPAVVQAKRRAADLAAREARTWAAADPVPQAYLALARAYLNVGRLDAAVASLDTALAEHPQLREGMLPFLQAQLVARARPEDGPAAVRAALRGATPEGLRREGGSDVIPLVLGAASVAAMGGSARDVDAVGALLSAARPTIPGPEAPTRVVVGWWSVAAKLAMGLPPASQRGVLDGGIAYVQGMPEALGPGARQQSAPLLYMAYLATREPRYLETLRRWRGPGAPPWPELDALEALARGDTARARELARGFPSADSIRAATGGMNATRWVARAQVFADLGDPRRAVAQYEVLDPDRFSEFGMVDPGFGLYARSFLDRGRLYEELGDRPRAIAAYERFLALWKDADPALDAQRREARAALARLRDAAGGARPVDVRRGRG
jgi:serine/threonine-protein kinase